MFTLQTERFVPLMHHHKFVYVEEMIKLHLRDILRNAGKPHSDNAIYIILTGVGFDFIQLKYIDDKTYLLSPKRLGEYEYL